MKEILLFIYIFVFAVSAWSQTSVTSTPNASGPDFARARQLLQQGKYDEAIAELQGISSAKPGMKGVAHELGMAYFKKSDYPQAIETFRKALQQDPEDNEATQLLGLSYYLSGNPSAAIPYLEKVQTWYPRANVDASYILGQCYIQTKNYSNAWRAFE